jgi:tRNA pseudouridine38-40 synthase
MDTPVMRCLKLTVCYDGTDYSGWQAQQGERTVQDQLEEALTAVTSERRRTIASGRTDAGVHALGQVVSVRTQTHLACDVFLRAMNANLPHDIRVLRVEEVSPAFHAIRDASSKRYRYVLQDGLIPDVFGRQYTWYVPGELDDRAMADAASQLVGKHDFACFQSSGSPRASTVRTIFDLTVARSDVANPSKIIVEVEADGFLYNMVRNIVGSLMYVGRGKHPVAWISELMARGDRRCAGPTAPAQGLFLVWVTYPPDSTAMPTS